MKNILLVLPFLFIVLGPLNAMEWKKLDRKDAEISVIGDDSFITGRTYGYNSKANVERIHFYGGTLIWDNLNTNVYFSDGSDLRYFVSTNFNRIKSFSKYVPLNVKKSDVKYKDDSRQGYHWVSQEGAKKSCLFSTGDWGVAGHIGGGNNRIVVVACRPGKKKPLEEFLHDLMSRVQIDGGAINKMKASNKYKEFGPKIRGDVVPKEQSRSSSKDQSSNQTIKSRLSKLKKLEDAGLITKEEAAEKRKAILDSL